MPNIGAVHARTLIDLFGDAASIFRAKRSTLERIEGIGSVRAGNIKDFSDFKKAEKELLFLERFKIRALFLTDEHYPKRFLNCYDPPTLFYYRGNADLNHSRMVAIVGTRLNTAYGRQVTEELVTGLAPYDVVVVSGLAFGIDAIAHKTALKYGIPTIGVVGHGLDTIYPGQHTALAKDMISNGGVLTEFVSGTKPDKHNFPIRNRIVAGISDITIVVETGIKGGSMITAEMANSYNRDVFAFPGRATDAKSAGCNFLIKVNKAALITDAQQLIETMQWSSDKKPLASRQKELFPLLSTEEKIIVERLSMNESVRIDELHAASGLTSSAVAAAILNLELQGLIASLPGKLYKLV